MTQLSRRHILSSLGSMSALALLPGCVTMKSGTTTSVVINTARIKAFVSAGLSAVTIVQNIVALVPGLTLYSQVIGVAADALRVSSDAFNKVAGDNLTLSYDSKNVKSAVDSVKVDIDKIYQVIVGVVDEVSKLGQGIPSGTLNKIYVVHDALLSIINIFSSLLGMGLTPSTDKALAFNTLTLDSRWIPMNETNALRVLRA